MYLFYPRVSYIVTEYTNEIFDGYIDKYLSHCHQYFAIYVKKMDHADMTFVLKKIME